ncbi:MAG: ABC transporter permease [Marvinbryantia sp.]|jgi:putative aldouronate transport system permease protein
MTASRLNSKRQKGTFASNLRRFWPAYVMILPVIVWYLIFAYLPMGGLVIAFKKFSVIKGIADSPWVGFDNFIKLFRTPSFLQSVKNTLIISGLNLLICFPIPIIFAILLNEIKQLRFKKFVQTVSYLPHFISWSVVGGMVYMILSPSTGVISSVVRTLGGTPQNYIGLKEYFRPIVVGTGIWKSMGWSAIIYVAAITSVDEQLYEAARLDGAGRFRRIWHVTLPGIRAIIAIQLILTVGQILNVSFDQIFILITDMTLEVGETIDYYIYRTGLGSSNNFSLATASGMFKSVIGLVLVLGTNYISKKLTDGEGIW